MRSLDLEEGFYFFREPALHAAEPLGAPLTPFKLAELALAAVSAIGIPSEVREARAKKENPDLDSTK